MSFFNFQHALRMQPHDYVGILIAGAFFAFWDAFGIGANDVANSFANSVAARTLTLKQACVIAAFTEFGGAILLGAETTAAVKNSIIDIKMWNAIPQQLMLGFMCALIASSFWVLLATRCGFPVSTTHSIVGAIAGVGISKFGWAAINQKEIWKIVLSWVTSPGISGAVAAIFYLITKYGVMQSPKSLRRGINAIPLFFVFTISIMMFFICNKAPKGIDLSKEKNNTSENWTTVLAISLGVGIASGLFVWAFVVPFFSRLLVEEEDLKWYHMFYIRCVPKQGKNEYLQQWLDGTVGVDHVKDVEAGDKSPDATFVKKEEETKKKSKVMGLLSHGMNVDCVNIEDERIKNIHDKCVKYDGKTEYLFSYLQVITACFASFAHGSNDVANAAGPLSAIVSIYNTATVATNVDVPFWLLATMGIAIDLGLVLYGYNIMKTLGNNITHQSPSRGFNMELGASFTVIVASFLGLPVSTTHCITGATVAVGLCNGEAGAINWKMIAWILLSWVLTVPFTGLIAGIFFYALQGAVN
jgi:sodium-dependent phosphate transporter